jgi:hypothetical protein
MPNPPAVLMVELVMSIDRMIQTAQSTASTREHLVVPGEWPPQVVLGHVSQVDEQVWLPRISLMCQAQELEHDAPSFTWWEPNPTATYEEFQAMTLADSAATAMASRTHLLTVVKNLSPEQWLATANHESFGVIDVSGLIIQILTHDEEHRASLL